MHYQQVEVMLSKVLFSKKIKRVALSCSDNFVLIQIIMFLWRKNIIPVILNPELKTADLRKYLNISQAGALICDRNVRIKPDGISVLKIHPDQLRGPSLPLNLGTAQQSKIQHGRVLLFTSGTVGVKAILLTKAQLEAAYFQGARYFNYESSETWLLSLPLYHISGFSIFFRALMAGQNLLVPASFHTDDLKTCLRNHEVDYLSVVPTQILRLMSTRTDLSRIKAIIIGGAAVQTYLIRSALKKRLKIFHVYGSTETAAFCCVLSYKDMMLKSGSAGKPLEDTKVLVLDESNRQLSSGRLGKIAVSGNTVIRKWQVTETAQEGNFTGKKFLTGDAGYLDEDGYLFISGRMDDMINSGGKKIFPVELEKIINKYRGVENCIVFGMPDREWGQKTALLIDFNRSVFNLQEFRTFLDKKLMRYQIPKNIFFAHEFPYTNIGKISRKLIAGQAARGNFEELK